MIGAHYYPWYGKAPNVVLGGGNWNSGTTHTPLLGRYSSDDDEIIKEHVNMAKKAGIDFFIIEWTGPGLYEDITIIEHVIPVFEVMQMPFCITYDSFFTLHKTETNPSWDLSKKYDSRLTKGMKMLDDFQYLSQKYFSHPLYVTNHQKPIVFIFLAYKYQDEDGYLKRLRIIEGMPEGGPFLIGDIISAYAGTSQPTIRDLISYFWNTPLSRIYKKLNESNIFKSDGFFPIISELDALSGYNLLNYNGMINLQYSNIMKELKMMAIKNNKHWIPFVFPGYDDINLRGEERKRYQIEREESGLFYRDLLKIAIKFIDEDMNMLIITSFNEWHEGTEIEPSNEYQDLYINLTSQISEKIKKISM